MRRNFMKGAMLGAMALAGLAGTGQVQSAKLAATPGNNVEYKATKKEEKTRKEKIGLNDVTGGLDMPHFSGLVGTPPKEYGQWLQSQRWYSMSRGKKVSNMNRYAHNAKLSRRMA